MYYFQQDQRRAFINSQPKFRENNGTNNCNLLDLFEEGSPKKLNKIELRKETIMLLRIKKKNMIK